jgi:hypothetical protein
MNGHVFHDRQSLNWGPKPQRGIHLCLPAAANGRVFNSRGDRTTRLDSLEGSSMKRSISLEVDALWNELTEPRPFTASSIEEIPHDAVAADVTRKTRGLPHLEERPNLRRLVARNLGDAEVRFVGQSRSLERVDLLGTTIANLRDLSSLGHLRILKISVNSRLISLEGIEALSDLRLLSAWHVPKLRSIDAVAGLRELRVLFLAGSTYAAVQIPSLDPISRLQQLTSLTLSNVRVRDRRLIPLAQLTQLRKLDLPLRFPPEEFEMLEEALPQAKGRWRSLWRSRVTKR